MSAANQNRCHWGLDVTFGEDHCQVRDRTAAHNFSLLRELALKTLRDHPGKLSLRRNAAAPPSIPTSVFKSSATFMRMPCSPTLPWHFPIAERVTHRP